MNWIATIELKVVMHKSICSAGSQKLRQGCNVRNIRFLRPALLQKRSIMEKLHYMCTLAEESHDETGFWMPVSAMAMFFLDNEAELGKVLSEPAASEFTAILEALRELRPA